MQKATVTMTAEQRKSVLGAVLQSGFSPPQVSAPEPIVDDSKFDLPTIIRAVSVTYEIAQKGGFQLDTKAFTDIVLYVAKIIKKENLSSDVLMELVEVQIRNAAEAAQELSPITEILMRIAEHLEPHGLETSDKPGESPV